MTDVVTLDGIQLVGDNMAELVYQKLAGWDGVPDSRGKNDSIPGRHGQYAATQVLREARAITLTGAIITDSTERFFDLKRQIEAVSSVCVMSVDQGDGAWVRGVEIDNIEIPDFHTRTMTTFSVDMVAPDPVRYRDVSVLGPVGLPVREGGLRLPEAFPWNFGRDIRSVLTVVNDGGLPVFPVVRITGSAASVVVSGGPRRVGFGAFEGELVFDASDRRALLNGGDVTRRMTRRDWPMVPPGVSHDFTFVAGSPSPDFLMTVEYQIGVW